MADASGVDVMALFLQDGVAGRLSVKVCHGGDLGEGGVTGPSSSSSEVAEELDEASPGEPTSVADSLKAGEYGPSSPSLGQEKDGKGGRRESDERRSCRSEGDAGPADASCSPSSESYMKGEREEEEEA